MGEAHLNHSLASTSSTMDPVVTNESISALFSAHPTFVAPFEDTISTPPIHPGFNSDPHDLAYIPFQQTFTTDFSSSDGYVDDEPDHGTPAPPATDDEGELYHPHAGCHRPRWKVADYGVVL